MHARRCEVPGCRWQIAEETLCSHGKHSRTEKGAAGEVRASLVVGIVVQRRYVLCGIWHQALMCLQAPPPSNTHTHPCRTQSTQAHAYPPQPCMHMWHMHDTWVAVAWGPLHADPPRLHPHTRNRACVHACATGAPLHVADSSALLVVLRLQLQDVGVPHNNCPTACRRNTDCRTVQHCAAPARCWGVTAKTRRPAPARCAAGRSAAWWPAQPAPQTPPCCRRRRHQQRCQRPCWRWCRCRCPSLCC